MDLPEINTHPCYKRLIGGLRKPSDVGLTAHYKGGPVWSIAVAAADLRGLQPLIAGLITAYGFRIINGDMLLIETSGRVESKDIVRPLSRRPGSNSQRTRRILNVFDITSNADLWNGPHIWNSLLGDLSDLSKNIFSGADQKVREEVAERLSKNFRETRGSDEKLMPVTMEIDNNAHDRLTRLRIVSIDTPGSLFALTNALDMLDARIETAAIRTINDEVYNTFWITDMSGCKITKRERIHQFRVACLLIKQFIHLLPASPNPGQALKQFRDLIDSILRHPDWARDFEAIKSWGVMDTLAKLMGVSRFLWEDFLRLQHENLFPIVKDIHVLGKRLSKETLMRRLHGEISSAGSGDDKVAVLNAFKDHEMFRIDLRHITGRIGDIPFSRELSDLTDAVLEQTALICNQRLEKRYGSPMLESGGPGYCILGAGKYGGREMGFASDIELIFVYEGNGHTAGENSVENSVYFEEFVRLFLKTLRTRQEGIFHIDLRLRPFGSKGTLACSLDAFSDYYSGDGPAQQFERMALVKLRPVAGDGQLAHDTIAVRDRFVYSGAPLDYGNIISLRHRQAVELVKGASINAKYSLGGLVDIEYFIQAKQIELGWDNKHLRSTNTMKALAKLEEYAAVAPELSENIRRAYKCLRRVIDALRVVRGNAKDLSIPSPESRAFSYLSRRLGYDRPEMLHNEILISLSSGRFLWQRETCGEKL